MLVIVSNILFFIYGKGGGNRNGHKAQMGMIELKMATKKATSPYVRSLFQALQSDILKKVCNEAVRKQSTHGNNDFCVCT